MPRSQPDPLDRIIGVNLRAYRRMLGMTLKKLGHDIGSKYQQIQKFENGASRLSAVQLYDISRAMGVPMEAFLDATKSSLAKRRRIALSSKSSKERS